MSSTYPMAKRAWPFIVVPFLLPLLFTIGTDTFVAADESVLRLPLLSGWWNVPTVFSRHFRMFTENDYRPLSYALLALPRTAVPVEAVWFWRAIFLLTHLANALLLAALVRRFTDRFWPPVAAGALLLLHPAAAFAVNDPAHFHLVLGLTFFLTTLLLYIAARRQPTWWRYLAALAAFALGLLASRVVAALPLVLLAYEVLYREDPGPRSVWRLAPYALAVSLYVALQAAYTPPPLRYAAREVSPQLGYFSLLTILAGGGSYAKTLLTGLGLAVFPHETVPRIHSLAEPRVFAWGGAALVAIGLSLWAIRRRRYAGFGLLIVPVSLLPFASVYWNRVAEFMAWQYLYVPVAGLALVAASLTDLSLGRPRWLRAFGAVVVLAAAGWYGFVSVGEVAALRSEQAYWERAVAANPGSAKAHVALGKCLLATGEPAAALRHLFAPPVRDFTEPGTAMMGYYAKTGEPTAVAAHLRHVLLAETVEYGPERAKLVGGRTLLQQGALDHADSACGNALGYNPYCTEAMRLEAEILLRRGHLRPAEAMLRQADSIEPGHPEARALRARIAAIRAGAEEAVRPVTLPDPVWVLYFMETDFPATDSIQGEVLATCDRHPDDPILAAEAGFTLVRAGKLPEAWPHLSRAVASLPEYGYLLNIALYVAQALGESERAVELGERALTHERSNRVLLSLAKALMDLRRWTEAREYLQQGLSFAADKTDFHYHLGLIAAEMGDYADAERQLKQALESAKEPKGIALTLARLYEATERPREAVGTLEELVRNSPDDFDAHARLATLLVSVGEREKGRGHYERAVELNPEDPDLRLALAQVIGASDATAALVQLEAAARQRPDDPRAAYGMGLMLLQTGRPREALAPLRRAAALAPSFAPAHNNLGVALAETGDLAGAVSEFRTALQIAPEDPDAKRNLDEALAKLGAR